MEITAKKLIESYAPENVPENVDIARPISYSSGKRFAIALAVAAVSDVLSVSTELVPPVQWTLDLITASALFLILGRRWAILPGLIAEAIPGLAAFPVWVLVVLAVMIGKK